MIETKQAIDQEPPQAKLTRGVSKVLQSDLQIDISRGFPAIASAALSPLAQKDCPDLGNEIAVIQTKAAKWHVPVQSKNSKGIETEKFVHLMEYLLPLNWTALKAFAQNPNNLPKKIRSCDNSRSLNSRLVKMVNDYLSGQLKDAPEDFLNVFGSWLQEQVNGNANRLKMIELFREDVTPAEFAEGLYQAFGQLKTVAICLHKVCEIANVPQSKLRERSAYLMLVYNYKDILSTTGVSFFVEKFLADQQKYLATKLNGESRQFRDVLYANPNSAMARLVRIGMDLSGMVPVSTPAPNRAQLRQLDPKLARLLRYAENRVFKETDPRTLVIVSGAATAPSVFEAFQQDPAFTQQSGALLLAKTSQVKRTKTLAEASDGTLDFIVTSELDKVPHSTLRGRVVIVFMPQKSKAIKEYSWIESLMDSASEVRAILMPVAYSSDQGRRTRAKRLGTVPELQDLEFDLTAPDGMLNQQAALTLYPNVRMLFAMSQKIKGMFSTALRNKRVTKDELEEFTKECRSLHEVTASTLLRVSDKRKFQKDLTTHYCDRLTNVWANISQNDTDPTDDPIKLFAICARILQHSAGYNGPLTSADSKIFRAAFSDAINRFMERFESQPVLPFYDEPTESLQDSRLAFLLTELQNLHSFDSRNA